MESTVSIHHGPYESIPATASPGLKFLRRFLPALDSLTPAETPISPFFTPSAPILIGSDPPTSASQAVPLLEVRSRHICKFHHHVYLAWDIDLGSDTGPVHTSYNRTAPDQEAAQRGQLYAPLAGNIQMKRTVMFEATSETTFKEDPDQFAVRVREFNVLDLEGRDESDLQIVEMRIFLDQRPVQAHSASLFTGSGYSGS
ncbi:hypothetical protein E8E15_004640 [Penicillium rubens]|jgi:hypothetical protein|uniref:Uncharacterized protein n=1 Tax=Penicillium chrysogenum TaxID=5076 RepID=A0ABQ8W8E7_PENCH|nr:uncharacterized protein N7489_007108 [Penicillium chrysogenum]XP_061071036.1 uncharacterized protein N7525_001221 [Penicillium rubens]KAF3017287.1 hypothetical protein E8E15_004640 [Penicillium rubens]KAJ5034782.1 hypothetical protein NUH16_006227 [Penicillium rubens]KAJ5237017.1 hypothetical protein N7489_007108 [Penicillium chrysogenum]KAJ5255956.1 hypothetical protein N7505_011107 [Penicillium chrysogenum]KAJ5276980.1 hypothetical protein N7524_003133 [Penicillium chrysogenum]